MFKKIIKLKEKEKIDRRIVDILWENLKGMEDWIEKEISKAWYIIWFQGTILFVTAMKIWNIDNFFIKIIIVILFILSLFLSYLTIKWEWKIKHLKFKEYEKFSRAQIVEKLNNFYDIAEKLFFKKLKLNKWNMLLQWITLFLLLLVLLFPKIFYI